ncbi:MAG: hypothetical protein ABIP51_20135 [Bacteroidia bacterium]
MQTNLKGFHVYFGFDKISKILVYIGTTIQKPKDRFRWHKANGKDLDFKIYHSCLNADEMIELEFELIKKHKPLLNNITHRKQNLNQKLSTEDLNKRKGNSEWCQSCLKRRVNKNYKFCNHC